jgi:hypothetical protein
MAYVTRKHLSRRTFLRGVGVSLALPLLDSMVPAATAFAQTAATPRTRLGAIYFPHGATLPKWIPATEGPGFALTEILEPIAPFRDQVNVISGLRHAQAYGSGATANHNRSAAAFLSGAFAKTGAQPYLGVTMDQVAARAIGVRLDEYLSDVREIERRVNKASQQLTDDLDVPAAPTGVPRDVEAHIALMYDLQALAWQTDMTRVSTLLLSKELSNTTYSNSGVRDAFHTLSHHSNIQENKDRFAVLNRYHVGLFAGFLEKLRATPDGDGTLLDHAIVLYGSGMGDGNQHNHTDLPVLLAGGASGRLKGDRHFRYPTDTPMANLLVTVLEKLGVDVEQHGDSTGMLAI